MRLLHKLFPGMVCIMDIHLEGDQHFRVIQDMDAYTRSYKYVQCSMRWLWPSLLNHHQATCQHTSSYHYMGGSYETKPRFHDLLCRLDIVGGLEHHYYLNRVTFDLDAIVVRTPTSAMTVGAFTNLHMPMSISLASNMAGHGGPYNFFSEGSPQRLVDDIIAYLWGMSDNADEMMSILKKGTCFTALFIRN